MTACRTVRFTIYIYLRFSDFSGLLLYIFSLLYRFAMVSARTRESRQVEKNRALGLVKEKEEVNRYAFVYRTENSVK